MTTLEAPPVAIHTGPEGRPDDSRTLGWEVLKWTAEYLQQPDGPNAGQPWIFTDEQARFVLWWYAIDDRGRFLNRYGMFRRMKGHGKDPLGAALCCVEFVGPCRFKEFGRDGIPVAVPHPAAWVQIAAVSRDQTRNTMTLFPGMISPQAVAKYNIDLGKEIIYANHGRQRIEAVTSSPRALEGGRSTFVLKNETQHWRRTDEGHEMAKVIARNLGKSRDGAARALAISNAHNPGEDSDAERDYDAWLQISQGLSPATGLLYDSLEAPPTDLNDRDSLRAGLLAARGDSDWLDVERLCDEIQDPRTSPAVARRFYLNQIAIDEDRPFDVEHWRSLARPDYKVAEGEQIVLGFDGSINRDWTALIGTEIATGFQWPLGIWLPSVLRGGEMRIDDEAVDQTLTWAFEHYKVWRLLGDPFWWRDWLSSWAGRFGKEKVVEWPTNQYRRMAYALADYHTAIEAGDLTHNGDEKFTAAISNAHKMVLNILDDDGEQMWVIQKERPDSPNKIDPAVAGALSWRARADAIANGVLNVNDWHGIDLGDDEEG